MLLLLAKIGRALEFRRGRAVMAVELAFAVAGLFWLLSLLSLSCFALTFVP